MQRKETRRHSKHTANKIMRNLPVRNVVLDLTEHVHDGLVDTEEDAVVDLKEAEELKDLADLGGNADDTADAHHKRKVRLAGHVVRSLRLSLAAQPNRVILKLKVESAADDECGDDVSCA